MDRLIEEAVEEAQGYVEEGFTAVKMKIGLGDPKLDIRRVAAVRDAIGADVRLMVDANHCLTVPQAIRLGRELEKLDVEWFEEPISPEDIDGYVEVTRALDMAVAGGENEMTRWGFRDLVVRKAMDIVQPDVCAAGGISECRKIATLAAAHGVECVPHAWGSVIGVAATLHFLAALPDQPPSFRPDAADVRVRAVREPVPRPAREGADRAGARQGADSDRRRARHRDRSQDPRPLPRRLSAAMRFVTFRGTGGAAVCGVLLGERVVDLSHRACAALLGETPPTLQALLDDGLDGWVCRLADAHFDDDAIRALADVHLLAPLPRPGKIVGAAFNFTDALAERRMAAPKEPVTFVRSGRTVIGPGEPILIPPDVGNVGYEGELAAVIGRRALRVSRDDAMRFVAGYTVHNDVSGSDLVKQDGGNFVRGKNLPASAPLGPALISADELPDPYGIGIRLDIDGRLCRTGRRGRCCSTSPT